MNDLNEGLYHCAECNQYYIGNRLTDFCSERCEKLFKEINE